MTDSTQSVSSEKPLIPYSDFPMCVPRARPWADEIMCGVRSAQGRGRWARKLAGRFVAHLSSWADEKTRGMRPAHRRGRCALKLVRRFAPSPYPSPPSRVAISIWPMGGSTRATRDGGEGTTSARRSHSPGERE